MSKSGLFAHFGSKEELQLATIETASALFTEQVIEPASLAPTGLERLRQLAENFLRHVEGDVYPGGCFFASVAAEMDTHPGPVRDLAVQVTYEWFRKLEAAVRDAEPKAQSIPRTPSSSPSSSTPTCSSRTPSSSSARSRRRSTGHVARWNAGSRQRLHRDSPKAPGCEAQQLCYRTFTKTTLFRAVAAFRIGNGLTQTESDYLALLLRAGESVEFPAGEVVFSEGDAAEQMFMVKSGSVSLLKGDRQLEVVEVGGMFGEMALIDREPRSASAVADTDCELVVIDKRRFWFLVQETPYFAQIVMRVMADRLRKETAAARA